MGLGLRLGLGLGLGLGSGLGLGLGLWLGLGLGLGLGLREHLPTFAMCVRRKTRSTKASTHPAPPRVIWEAG